MSEIESPSAVYLAGRREWNERYGSYIARARQWRAMAFGLLATTTISTCCAVWLASQAHVVPYIVEVNKLGERVTVGPVPPAPPINTGTIKAQLARWIIDTRTVYSDPIAEQNIMTEAYTWVDRQSDALAQLDVALQANDPRAIAAKKTVGVSVETVGQIGADTWSVDWNEESRSRDGSGQLMTYWRASVRIKISPPTDEETIIANPAGIYIEWFKTTPRSHRMRPLLLVTAAVFVSSPAWADPYQVPALANANATARGLGAVANANATATSTPSVGPSTSIPAGMPPAINRLSPSAPLNAKEKTSAQMAQAWRNHNDRPSRGEDGVLRWTFGVSLPSVVCSPLEVCDIALQAGEVVNSVHVGDKVRWSVLPAVAGAGADRTTHLIVKPSDAGLVSSILVYTDQRIYSIKLISTQTQWTPLTAFVYPDTAQAAWANYGATMTADSGGKTVSASSGGDINFDYLLSGDAPWRPIRVYSAAGKTFIQFPDAMRYGSAPALVGLANDGGWFASPSQQMLRYRIAGDRYVVDGVLDRAELVSGVGSGQTKVDIRRSH